jgi:hypothetical protein
MADKPSANNGAGQISKGIPSMNKRNQHVVPLEWLGRKRRRFRAGNFSTLYAKRSNWSSKVDCQKSIDRTACSRKKWSNPRT